MASLKPYFRDRIVLNSSTFHQVVSPNPPLTHPEALGYDVNTETLPTAGKNLALDDITPVLKPITSRVKIVFF
jgi:hypothetical protein